MNKNTVLSSAGLLGTAMIWGFAFVVVKSSLDTITPFYMIAIRFSIAAIALGAITFKRLFTINRKMIVESLIMALFLFFSYAVQTIGCKYTTAGKNAFLTAIYVVLVPFCNWILTKKQPNIVSFFAAFAALAGIGLITLSGSDSGVNIGDMLTVLCGITYAIHMVATERFTKTSDPVVLAVLQLFFSAVFSWIAAPIAEGAFPQITSAVTVFSMLYLGLLSTMVCFLLQTVCQKYTPAANASLLLSTEAVFGALSSVIFLHEEFTTNTIIGCALVFAAITVPSIIERKQTNANKSIKA